MSSPDQTTFIDPKYTEQHYHSSIYKGYLLFLKNHFGEDRARQYMSSLPLTWDYLYSDSNWVSEAFSEIFYETISNIPDIPKNFSYQAGCLTMSPENIGPIQYWFVRFLSVKAIFSQSVSIVKKIVKVDKLDVLENKDGSIAVKFTSNRETKFLNEIGENWRGHLESLPALHGLERGKCEIVKLDERTMTIRVTWKHEDSRLWSKIISLGPWIGVYSVLLAMIFKGDGATTSAAVAALVLMVTIQWQASREKKMRVNDNKMMDDLIKNYEERYKELHSSKVKLDRRYKESRLVKDVIERITQTKSSEELINLTIREIKETLGYDRVLFMKHNHETNTLFIHSTSGFDPESEEAIKSYSIDLSEITDKDFHLGNLYKNKRSILIPVTKDYLQNLSHSGKSMIEVAGSKSFIACTTASDRTSFGVMLVDYCTTERELNNDDLHIIQNLCNQLAILLEDAFTLEKEVKLRTSFQRFVPQEVIKRLTQQDALSSRNDASLRDVTILFSDIRNFVAKSERFAPSDIVRALNYYFSEMNNIVYAHKGIVDKFMGDGLMAVFNAFDTDPSHAVHACAAAIEMQNKLAKINQRISSMLNAEGVWQPITIGVGIHTGASIIGNIGSDHKMEFTAIGRTVNVAARLQDLTKKFEGIIISEDVKKLLPTSSSVQSLGNVDIRGLSGSTCIYQLDYLKEKRSSDELAA